MSDTQFEKYWKKNKYLQVYIGPNLNGNLTKEDLVVKQVAWALQQITRGYSHLVSFNDAKLVYLFIKDVDVDKEDVNNEIFKWLGEMRPIMKVIYGFEQKYVSGIDTLIDDVEIYKSVSEAIGAIQDERRGGTGMSNALVEKATAALVEKAAGLVEKADRQEDKGLIDDRLRTAIRTAFSAEGSINASDVFKAAVLPDDTGLVDVDVFPVIGLFISNGNTAAAIETKAINEVDTTIGKVPKFFKELADREVTGIKISDFPNFTTTIKDHGKLLPEFTKILEKLPKPHEIKEFQEKIIKTFKEQLGANTPIDFIPVNYPQFNITSSANIDEKNFELIKFNIDLLNEVRLFKTIYNIANMLDASAAKQKITYLLASRQKKYEEFKDDPEFRKYIYLKSKEDIYFLKAIEKIDGKYIIMHTNSAHNMFEYIHQDDTTMQVTNGIRIADKDGNVIDYNIDKLLKENTDFCKLYGITSKSDDDENCAKLHAGFLVSGKHTVDQLKALKVSTHNFENTWADFDEKKQKKHAHTILNRFGFTGRPQDNTIVYWSNNLPYLSADDIAKKHGIADKSTIIYLHELMKIAGTIDFSQKGGGGGTRLNMKDIPALIENIKASVIKLTVNGYDFSQSKATKLTQKLIELEELYKAVKDDFEKLAITKYIKESSPNTEINDAMIITKKEAIDRSIAELQAKQATASKWEMNLFQLLSR